MFKILRDLIFNPSLKYRFSSLRNDDDFFFLAPYVTSVDLYLKITSQRLESMYCICLGDDSNSEI